MLELTMFTCVQTLSRDSLILILILGTNILAIRQNPWLFCSPHQMSQGVDVIVPLKCLKLENETNFSFGNISFSIVDIFWPSGFKTKECTFVFLPLIYAHKRSKHVKLEGVRYDP